MSEVSWLALHGNLGSTEDWEDLGLANLHAVDLWEHTSLSFLEMAHELATTLSPQGEQPIVAGYSLGGRLALHAMAIHPRRWRGAVIASAHPGLPDASEREARREVDREWARKAREMDWQDFLQAWNAQGVLASSPVPGGQAALEGRRAEVARAFETWSLGRQENLRGALRGFFSPVLWIVGEEDGRFREIGSEMAEIFPDFTLAVIPGAGHRVLGTEAAGIMKEWATQLPAET